MLVLKDYKTNQFGILLMLGHEEEDKLIPWHSILTMSKKEDDVQLTISLVSLATITVHTRNKEILRDIFDEITGLTEVAV